ncbi:DUF1800 domain-containing protein [Dyadobacter crusticola]|uniref:DUF1800 domain-containing protein n=1 Tax=Dyadobacter crusticola TaxID=292407 RepID=UPI0004E14413|nr:DUF1800 domain-containing protein [Dyadobacter crusticola]
MPYLDPFSQPLSARNAAHLLRRATFGPTPEEIVDFTGLSASEAIDALIKNAALTLSPAPPVVMDDASPIAGQTFTDKPFDYGKSNEYSFYVKYWWIGLMAEQNGKPSVLEKITAFWQNHFVTTQAVVTDYRLSYQYIALLRKNSLGNFKTLVSEITKDAAMLIYQNGNQNEKDHPNENYARELQELFTVGQRDYANNPNYTDEDVKAAARLLTGWQVENESVHGSAAARTVFNPDRHDTGDKKFSDHYNNTTIKGRAGANAGNEELSDLVDMLTSHPECPRFICRKLYRWYVNTDVTPDIENNVIVPLANFFASAENNFALEPVLRKLLSSEIFYHPDNIGSIIKSPAELLVGCMRFFKQPVPDMKREYMAFKKYVEYIHWRMYPMQLNLLDQPLVFGSLPYYQTGYSVNWINSASIGMRRMFTDQMVYPTEIYPGYKIGIDLVKWVSSLQPNFSDVEGTPCITCEQVFEAFSKNLFVHDLFPSQKEFLIDKIMMYSAPRKTWEFEFNAYRRNPNQETRSGILWRLEAVMKYMMSMAEFQIF